MWITTLVSACSRLQNFISYMCHKELKEERKQWYSNTVVSSCLCNSYYEAAQSISVLQLLQAEIKTSAPVRLFKVINNSFIIISQSIREMLSAAWFESWYEQWVKVWWRQVEQTDGGPAAAPVGAFGSQGPRQPSIRSNERSWGTLLSLLRGQTTHCWMLFSTLL